MKRNALVSALLLCFCVAAGAKELKNCAPIMAGGAECIDKMSFKGCYSHKPLGWAYITSSEYPDFLVNNQRGLQGKGVWLCTPDGFAADGSPIYKQNFIVKTIWTKIPPRLKLFQDGKNVYLIALESKKLIVTRWDGEKFDSYIESPLQGLSNLVDFDIVRRDRKSLEIAVLKNNGVSYDPVEDPNAIKLSRYDGAGVYRGRIPRGGILRFCLDNNFCQTTQPELVTPDLNVIQGPSRIACVISRDGKFNGYVIGGNIGAMKYVPYMAKLPVGGIAPEPLRNEDGSVYSSRANSNQFIAFPSSKGDRSGILAGGECAPALYSHIGEKGKPVYSAHKYIQERNAPLYGGSLVVPNVVDWDGDGILDIVAGNSEGRLLFFKNNGSSASPDFAPSVELEVDGEPIHFLPGYYIVQGPFEGAWGYLCPTVFDWNDDGLPDVVFSGSRARYEVMLNVGTRTEPRLAQAKVIRFDNMELHGTWRVRPGIYREKGETYMVILDDDNALHKYRRLDDTNVEDAGKILLEDGRQITGHNNAGESMGQRGRGKIKLVDWDGDGDLDVFIGSVKRNSYPSPEDGLPYRRFKKKEIGLQVMYFENTGDFKLKEPVQIQIDGKDVYLGAHSNAPEPCMLGDTSNGLNLLVGCESGKFWFFERQHITYIK